MANPDGDARAMWARDDYATIGDQWVAIGQQLVSDVGVAGLDVLDIATGTGATAIAAAAAGGRVTGLDVTPELLARRRTRRGGGVEVAWVEADMMDLPDQDYDRVLSALGVMFTADAPAMASEMVRLCRPGGIVATCAWTPDDVLGRLGPALAPYLPEPPSPAPCPPRGAIGTGWPVSSTGCRSP